MTPDTGPCGHGTAADGPAAGANALMAGTDSEMVSTNIRDYGAAAARAAPDPMTRLNDAVRRILRVKFRAGLFDHPYVDQAKASDPASFLTAGRPGRGPQRRRQVDGAAEERRQHAAARPEQEDRGDRPARRRPARHARPVVGPGRGRGRRQRVRRLKAAAPGHDVHPGLHHEEHRAAGPTTPADECSDRRRLRRGGRGGAVGRPGRAGARRDPGDERRGRGPLARSTCPASSRS